MVAALSITVFVSKLTLDFLRLDFVLQITMEQTLKYILDKYKKVDLLRLVM